MQRWAYDHVHRHLSVLKDGEVGKDLTGNPLEENQWVNYKDAKKAVEAASKQSDANLHLEINRLNWIIDGLDAKLNAKGADPKANNQLLNELYHDRARLERELKRFADAAIVQVETLEVLLNRDYEAKVAADQHLLDVVTASSRLGAIAEGYVGD